MTGLDPVGDVIRSSKKGLPRRADSPDEAVLSERDQLVLELVEIGISVRKAESLVSKYHEKLIRKQLTWLPFRAARRPASLLIASIEHDYDKPAYARD